MIPVLFFTVAAACAGLLGVLWFHFRRPFLPEAPAALESANPEPEPARDEAGADDKFGDELRAMNTALQSDVLPLDPTEAKAVQEFDHACRLAEQRYTACAERIDLALTEFAAAHTTKDGQRVPAVELPANPQPASSIEIALLRLRIGVREPVGAVRPLDGGTSEWDVAGLRAVLDAEDLVGAR